MTSAQVCRSKNVCLSTTSCPIHDRSRNRAADYCHQARARLALDRYVRVRSAASTMSAAIRPSGAKQIRRSVTGRTSNSATRTARRAGRSLFASRMSQKWSSRYTTTGDCARWLTSRLDSTSNGRELRIARKTAGSSSTSTKTGQARKPRC